MNTERQCDTRGDTGVAFKTQLKTSSCATFVDNCFYFYRAGETEAFTKLKINCFFYYQKFYLFLALALQRKLTVY